MQTKDSTLFCTNFELVYGFKWKKLSFFHDLAMNSVTKQPIFMKIIIFFTTSFLKIMEGLE